MTKHDGFTWKEQLKDFLCHKKVQEEWLSSKPCTASIVERKNRCTSLSSQNCYLWYNFQKNNYGMMDCNLEKSQMKQLHVQNRGHKGAA